MQNLTETAGHVHGVVPKKAERYVFIDALRGLAALAVVFFHAKQGQHLDALYPHIAWPFTFLFSHGALGVQVFFVLSGFVIAHSMARHEIGPSYIGRFLLRRSIRLDPPYYGSMALVVALALLSVHFVQGKVYAPPSVSDVVLHMLYLPVLLERPLISDVYWTLCLEMQFYIVFALVMWLVTRLRARAREGVIFPGALLVMCTISVPWLVGRAAFVVPGLFLEYWHFFLTGVLAWRASLFRHERATLGLSVVYLSGMLLAAVWLADPARAVAVFSAATILFAGRLGKLTSWLKAAPFQQLGAWSYSLYLTHNPVSGALFRLGYRLTGRSAVLEAFWLVVVVAACIAVAWLFHVAIERPSLRFSHRIQLHPGLRR